MLEFQGTNVPPAAKTLNFCDRSQQLGVKWNLRGLIANSICDLPDKVVDLVPDADRSIVAAGGQEFHLVAGGEAGYRVHVVILRTVVVTVWNIHQGSVSVSGRG